MKTNNRPTIKLVEWEVRTKSDFLLWNSPDDTAIWDGERTGNTREVERPMNDTEYIEYLEKEVNERTIVARNLMGNSLSLQRENRELKEWKIKSLEESIERINAYKFNLMYQKDELIKIVNSVLENNSKEIEYGQISNAQIIEKIEKAMNEIEYEIPKITIELPNKEKEQFLKVVESVIKEHHIYGTYRDDYGNSIIMCNCENEFSRKDYREHLLQEIKSAIEKGKE